jgi:hypothetical protein
MNKATELLKATEDLARSTESWADLANALYDPNHGVLARAFTTRAEREAFVQTAEYRRIQDILAQARDRFGLITGATPKQCGRLVVSVPLALQASLEREAVVEGLSLNQLVVAKLAAPLKHMVGAG